MKTMVAGVGNIFLGDDGFGCEVIARLRDRALPAHVRVEDYGVRGTHLALDLLDGYETLILVDTLAGDEAPGTVRLVELATVDAAVAAGAATDAHAMTPESVLRMVANMGGRLERVLVVGCQPASVAEGIGLSAPVHAAVDAAVRIVESLADEPCA
ncbi:MAG TPA: hydrogenase maturation protease [Acidimicrobiales bacterium]|nr:hydrogenase maturation protease [Acidimicrobiales bacterium]